jgi:hypothetical protein
VLRCLVYCATALLSVRFYYLTDCDDPVEALSFWDNHLIDFERKHWAAPEWEIFRPEDDVKENFVFSHKRVVFASINLVGGTVHDEDEFIGRNEANLDMIDDIYRDYRRDASIVIIFAHAAPPGESFNKDFYDTLFQSIENRYTQMRFVIIHRNGIDQMYGIEKKYKGIENLDVISVLGPIWPPLQITVDTKKNPKDAITLNFDEWFNEELV